MGPSSSKKHKLPSQSLAVDDVDEIFEIFPVIDLTYSKEFTPLALISQWDETPTTTSILTVAKVLPYGVVVSDFMIRINTR